MLLAFLEQGLVQQHAWLPPQQLLDAIAIGQFTPGSVLSTATFIGYIVGACRAPQSRRGDLSAVVFRFSITGSGFGSG